MKNRRRFVVARRMKLAAISADAGVGQDGVERLQLIGGREHRAAHQPFKVWAFSDEGVEFRQPLGDGLGLAIVLGERKQGGRVTSGYAGNNRVFLCHVATSESAQAQPRRVPEGCSNLRNP